MKYTGKVTKVLLVVLSGLAGCATPDAPGRAIAPVVYGVDDRQDVYAHPSASLQALAHESIVALIRSTRLSQLPDGSYEANPTLTLGEANDLCSDQRFIEQPTSAFCSGTLVTPNIVLTAGHCVDTLARCQNTRFVFDYLYTAQEVLAPLEADDVYRCAEILSRQEGVLDYAYVRLDRDVVGHSPAALSPGVGNTCRNAVDEEPVSVLGFGSGIPLKIDSGGVVIDPAAPRPEYFLASLDTFGGNSGSGVFNASGQLLGVVANGLRDYRARAGENCMEVNVLPEASGSEEIGHLLPTLLGYCGEASAPDAVLCAGVDDACSASTSDAGVDLDAGTDPDAGSVDLDAGIDPDAGVAFDAGSDAGGDASTGDMGSPPPSGSSCSASGASRGSEPAGDRLFAALLALVTCARTAARSRRVRTHPASRSV